MRVPGPVGDWRAWFRPPNRILAAHGMVRRFYYCNSGGDSALTPSEMAEDNTSKGVVDFLDCLQRAEECFTRHESRTNGGRAVKNETPGNRAPVLYVGVTCGMSAPYVAGQLQYILKQGTTSRWNIKALLIGFNPVEMARDLPIETWREKCNADSGAPRTFRDVAIRLQAAEAAGIGHVILNPVVGPEPLCGSTRMKGGTMTKVLLETIFAAAMCRVPNYSTTSFMKTGGIL